MRPSSVQVTEELRYNMAETYHDRNGSSGLSDCHPITMESGGRLRHRSVTGHSTRKENQETAPKPKGVSTALSF